MYNQAEQHLQKIPVLGDLIAARRGESIPEFQRTASQEVLNKTGQQLTPGIEAGPEMAKDLAAQHQASYNKAPMEISSKPEFQNSNEAIYNEAVRRKFPEDQQMMIRDAIDNTINGQLDPNGLPIKNENIQAITSGLSGDAYNLGMKQGDYWAPKTAQLLKKLQGNVENLMQEQNPDTFPLWKQAQSEHGPYKVLQRAEGYAGSGPGNVNPNDLYRAAMAKQPAGAKATANIPLSELALAGRQVIPTTTPNSGTATGNILAGMIGLGHIPAYGAFGPSSLLPAAGISALYTKRGQALARSYMLARRNTRGTIRNIMDRYVTQFGSPIAGQIAAQNQP